MLYHSEALLVLMLDSLLLCFLLCVLSGSVSASLCSRLCLTLSASSSIVGSGFCTPLFSSLLFSRLLVISNSLSARPRPYTNIYSYNIVSICDLLMQFTHAMIRFVKSISFIHRTSLHSYRTITTLVTTIFNLGQICQHCTCLK